MRARITPLLAVLAVLAFAAPASAFDPPELFVRTSDPTAPGPWLALASAPTFEYMGPVDIGMRVQPSPAVRNRQAVVWSATSVPDGQPTQPTNNPPTCVNVIGEVGEIVQVSPLLQYEGNGSYTVAVSVGPDTDSCKTGPTTSGSFTYAAHSDPHLDGTPLTFRATPLPGSAFSGVETPEPAGGTAEIECAIDATVNPDGSLTGRVVVPPADDPARSVREGDLSPPGAWACVGRGSAEGVDDNFDRLVFHTPWSAPLRFTVLSDFRRVRGQLAGPRSKKPRFAFTAEFPKAVAGGKGTFKVQQVTGCRGHKIRYKRFAGATAKFDSKGRAKFTIKHPRKDAYYVGTLSFGGTRLIRKSVDPQGVLLANRGAVLSFVQAIPPC